MRACGESWRCKVAMAGTLCALLLATVASAQTSGNPLRKIPLGETTRLEPTSVETVQPQPRVAGIQQMPSSPRRFTDYEVWGDEAPTSVRPGINPLRQAQHSEELPRPPAPSPQQALRANGWDGMGPNESTDEIYDESMDPWHNTLFSHGWFVHTDPNDPHRSIGWGEPLVGTSWRNRPWYVGAFIGGIFPGDLISGHVRQNNSALGGIRFGHDFDHYWGIEGRFAYSNPHLTQPDGTPLAVSRNYLADVELLYYPWGDSCWRPYLTIGLGQATFRFTDDQNRSIHESLLSMPVGCGFKYFHSPQTTIRFDLVENLAFGSDTIDNQANFSLMAAVEFRFGGRRPSYYPWHGNTVGW